MIQSQWLTAHPRGTWSGNNDFYRKLASLIVYKILWIFFDIDALNSVNIHCKCTEKRQVLQNVLLVFQESQLVLEKHERK